MTAETSSVRPRCDSIHFDDALSINGKTIDSIKCFNLDIPNDHH